MSLSKHYPTNRNSRLSRLIRAVFDWGSGDLYGRRGWCLCIHIGPGAGYGRWIFNRRVFLPIGWTFYIGRKVRGGKYNLYRDTPFAIGLTRSGNVAPYATH